MIVKNVSGYTAIFNLGRKSTELEDKATWILPDDDMAVFRDARRYEESGHLDILEGPEFKQSLASRTLPAWGTVTFSGTGIAEDTITIDGVVFELDGADPPVAATPGNTPVEIGATAAETAENLADAVNADSAIGVKASFDAGVVYLYHKTNGVDGSSVTLAKDCSAAAVSGATLEDGTYGAALGTVVATVEAADTGATVVTGLSSITHAFVQLKSALGVVKSFTGTVTYADGVIIIGDTADPTEVTAGDLFTVIAVG
jgi:hypothetical protein